MSNLWTIILKQPLSNALLFIIAVIPGGNIGLAVIILTCLVKLLLLPLSYQSLKTQIAQKKIQPEVDAIKKTVTDRQEQAKQLMALYKQYNVKPFASVLVMLIQLPIIIALYTVFLNGVDATIPLAYSFITVPDASAIATSFLGINLAAKSIILAIIAALAQFAQIHFSPVMRMTRVESHAANDMSAMMASSMQRSMKYVLPIMIAFFGAVVPGAVALYWIVSSLVTLLQEIILFKKLSREVYGTTR